MNLGNLGVRVTADIGSYSSNFDLAERKAKTTMAAAGGSVDDFRASLLNASNDIQRVAQNIGSHMEAANDAIVSNSEKSVKSIEQVADAAGKADFTPMSERIADAVGKGIGVGIVAAEKGWDGFVEYSKTKAIVVGLAVSAAFAAIGLGAVYTAYKVISGSLGFITGLITGDSYKSENIDALIEANNQVKEIQTSLAMTAQQAAATNAALASLGVDKPAYISTFTSAADSIRSNTDELDRLGVAYKDAEGKLLPLDQVVRNANDVLQSYTEGWDRNKAATAIGLGSAAAVAAAASVTSEKIAEARDRLNDYNLGIGSDTQTAVKAYETAMRDFNRESDLTSQGFKRAWADNVMPILTDLAVFFKDGFPSAVNAFRYSIATVTTLFYGLKEAIYVVAESILGSLQAIGMGVSGLATAAARALTGDFTGAKDALVQGWSDARDRMALIGANIVAQTQHNAAAVKQAWAMDNRTGDGVLPPPGKSWTPPPDKEKDAARAAVDPFPKDMMNLDRTQAGIEYVIANFDKFQGKVKESKAAMADFDTTLGKYSDKQRALDGFDPLTPAQKASYIAKNQLIDQGIEKERQMQVLRKLDNSAQQFSFKEQQSLDFRKQDVEWMGKSQVELAKLTEARRIDGEVAAMVNQTQIELGKQGMTISAERLQSLRDRAEAAKAASLGVIDEQYEKSRDPWFNASESIRRYGEDAANSGAQIGSAISNGFKTAEDAAVSFATTGKISFSSLANSILADMVRIQVRSAASGLTSMFTSIASAFFAPSAEASGSTNGGVIDADARGSYATGGPVTGPGTGTSDDVSAWLSNGEFVMNAEATKRNYALLERLNSGGAANEPHFASGGIVGSTSGAAATNAGGGGAIAINLVNQSGVPMQAQASRNPNGTIDVLLTQLKSSVADDISSGRGDIHAAIQSRFGLKAS